MKSNRTISGMVVTDTTCRWSTADEKYHVLFENVEDGVICTNSIGIIEDLNSKTLEIFACNREDIVGKHYEVLFELFDPKDDKQISELAIDPDSARGSTIKWYMKNKKGANMVMGIQHKRIRKGDQTIGSLILLKDLTDIKGSKKSGERDIADIYIDIINKDITRNVQEITENSEMLLSKLESLEEHICICDSSNTVNGHGNEILILNDRFLVDKDHIEECKKHVRSSLDKAIALNYLISNAQEILKLSKDEQDNKRMDVNDIIGHSIDRIRNIFYSRKIIKLQSVLRYRAMVKGNEIFGIVFDNILCSLINTNDKDEVSLYVSVVPTESGKEWRIEVRDNGDFTPEMVGSDPNIELDRSENFCGGSSFSLGIVNELVRQYGGEVLLEACQNGIERPSRNFVIILPRG